MSCYSQTETAAAFAAHRTFSVRDVFSGVFGWVRVACNRRRQRQELIEYLANDHRAANDLGITTDVRNLFAEARTLCTPCARNVCLWSQSGHCHRAERCLLSEGKADMAMNSPNVCF
jgi:hypothetical protein